MSMVHSVLYGAVHLYQTLRFPAFGSPPSTVAPTSVPLNTTAGELPRSIALENASLDGPPLWDDDELELDDDDLDEDEDELEDKDELDELSELELDEDELELNELEDDEEDDDDNELELDEELELDDDEFPMSGLYIGKRTSLRVIPPCRSW